MKRTKKMPVIKFVVLTLIVSGTIIGSVFADDLDVRVRTRTFKATELPEADVQALNPNPGAYFKVKFWGDNVTTPKNLAFRLSTQFVETNRCRSESGGANCTTIMNNSPECSSNHDCVVSVCTVEHPQCTPGAPNDQCPLDSCEVIQDFHGSENVPAAYGCGIEFADGEYVLQPNTPSFTNLWSGEMHHMNGFAPISFCPETCDDTGRCMVPFNDQGAHITEISFDATCWISVDAADGWVDFKNDPVAGCLGATVCP